MITEFLNKYTSILSEVCKSIGKEILMYDIKCRIFEQYHMHISVELIHFTRTRVHGLKN